MKLYREVKASDKLPDKEGPYFVMMKKQVRDDTHAKIFDLHDIYIWRDSEEMKEVWLNTFESWLESIEITEEEIEVMIREKSAEVAERINVTTDPSIKDDVYESAFKEIAAAILSKLKGE